jgi:hypothetical protein
VSDHKTNPTAVFRAMLPELLPHGFAHLIQFVLEVVPAAGVLPYPAEHMRKIKGQTLPNAPNIAVIGQGDRFEIQEFGKEEWVAPPAGVRVVHPIGQPLPPELCDVVLMYGTSVQDGMKGGLVTAGGQPARFPTSHLMHGELMRMPLVEWQKQHMVQLRGPVA